MNIEAVEICSCAGGMALGFRRAGIEFGLVVDRDEDACASYTHNLGHAPLRMDLRDLLRLVQSGWRPPRRLDLIVADPPCQPYSTAGKQLHLADERDCMMPLIELVKLLDPRAFLLGNVPGLEHQNAADALRETVGQLSFRGYCIDHVVLDAADHGYHELCPEHAHLVGRLSVPTIVQGTVAAILRRGPTPTEAAFLAAHDSARTTTADFAAAATLHAWVKFMDPRVAERLTGSGREAAALMSAGTCTCGLPLDTGANTGSSPNGCSNEICFLARSCITAMRTLRTTLKKTCKSSRTTPSICAITSQDESAARKCPRCSSYAVPQRRIRPFWFCHKGGPCITWPAPTHGPPSRQLEIGGTEIAPWVTCRQALCDLPIGDLGKIRNLRQVVPKNGGGGHPWSEPDAPAHTICARHDGGSAGGDVLKVMADGFPPSHVDEPGRTVTTRASAGGNRMVVEPITANAKHPASRLDAPGHTVAAKARGNGGSVLEWPWDRPATTVCGENWIPQPGHTQTRVDKFKGKPYQGWRAVVLSERARARLQSFPDHLCGCNGGFPLHEIATRQQAAEDGDLDAAGVRISEVCQECWLPRRPWIFAGKTKGSRNAQIGMAMSPLLAEAVARSVKEWFEASS